METNQEKIDSWLPRFFKAGYYRRLGVLAEEFGVSHNTLSAWIHGHKTPKAERIDQVENFLKEKGV